MWPPLRERREDRKAISLPCEPADRKQVREQHHRQVRLGDDGDSVGERLGNVEDLHPIAWESAGSGRENEFIGVVCAAERADRERGFRSARRGW